MVASLVAKAQALGAWASQRAARSKFSRFGVRALGHAGLVVFKNRA